ESAVRDLQAVLEFLRRLGGHDHAAFLDAGDADVEQPRHRRRFDLASDDLAHVLQAAHHAARVAHARTPSGWRSRKNCSSTHWPLERSPPHRIDAMRAVKRASCSPMYAPCCRM